MMMMMMKYHASPCHRCTTLVKEVQATEGKLIATQNQLETALMEADMMRMETPAAAAGPGGDSELGAGSLPLTLTLTLTPGGAMLGAGSPMTGERRQRDVFRSKAAACRLLYRIATKGGPKKVLPSLLGFPPSSLPNPIPIGRRSLRCSVCIGACTSIRED